MNVFPTLELRVGIRLVLTFAMLSGTHSVSSWKKLQSSELQAWLDMAPRQGALNIRQNVCTHSMEVNKAISSCEDGTRLVGIKQLAHDALSQLASSESGLVFSLLCLRPGSLACAILPPVVSW